MPLCCPAPLPNPERGGRFASKARPFSFRTSGRFQRNTHMALMASIATFSRLEGRELVHWLIFLYFLVYRIKIYLDDLQFYGRVDKGFYRSRVEVHRGIEIVFAVASWTLWISVAVL